MSSPYLYLIAFALGGINGFFANRFSAWRTVLATVALVLVFAVTIAAWFTHSWMTGLAVFVVGFIGKGIGVGISELLYRLTAKKMD